MASGNDIDTRLVCIGAALRDQYVMELGSLGRASFGNGRIESGYPRPPKRGDHPQYTMYHPPNRPSMNRSAKRRPF